MAFGSPFRRPLCLFGIAVAAIAFFGMPATHAGTDGVQSTAMRGCTQEDAPAIEIYMPAEAVPAEGEPRPPYIRIEIAAAPSERLAPLSLTLSPLRRQNQGGGRIARAESVKSEGHSQWLSGRVNLIRFEPDVVVAGNYDLSTPAGESLHGSFSAKWKKRTALCG